MHGGPAWRRPHRLSLVLFAVLAGAALFAAVVARGTVRQNDDTLLRQDAEQASMVFGSLLGQVSGEFTSLAPIIAQGPPALQHAVAALAQGSKSGVAVLHVDAPGTLTVLDTAGTIRRDLAGASASPLAQQVSKGATGVVGVVAGTPRAFGEVVSGVPFAPGYGIYVEIPMDPYVSLQSLPGVPFSGVDVAAYFGRERSDELILASSRNLPLRGERAVAEVSADFAASGQASISRAPGTASSPGHVILVMTATRELSGTLSSLLPWILLGGGVVCAFAVASVVEIALRRRDHALRLVADLEEKNHQLDEAYRRHGEIEAALHKAQRMEAIGQLAGGIAHDFNNLLHVISSYAGFFEESLAPDAPERADVEEIRRAAGRASELTRQLLTFSRRDAVKPGVVDVKLAVQEAVPFLRHSLGEDIDISCTVSDRPCHIEADAGQITQVIMNLGLNARDAMPSGGRLALDVRAVDLDPGTAGPLGIVPGPYVRMEVTDSGVGMSPEVVERAFEPFFTTKGPDRGTGLGLAMVYGIATRWSGRTQIASAPGLGTKVTLYFPRSDKPVAPEPAARLAEGPGGHETILLVEDEEAVRRSTTRILERAGYRVVVAADGASAEAACDPLAIDLLLTDVVMPGGMSGTSLAERLRRTRPDLPVVFISGYNSDAIAQRGLLPASSSLVEKPFTSCTLLEAIRRHLNAPEAALT